MDCAPIRNLEHQESLTWICIGKDLLEVAHLAEQEEIERFSHLEEVDRFSDLDEVERFSDRNNILGCCQHCPDPLYSHVASDERISEFKKYQEIHDAGLQVDYRCPKCQDCLDCKNSERTESISLKEEWEMYAIKQSVHLDFENGKIQCSLPLKGKERDYLSCNKDRALKVLHQQCKKYGNDPEIKQSILDAFSKLFVNGHARLIM